MVIKLYISGISGNKEVKKKQQRVQMILDSKQINYEAIDITEPGKEKDKEFMQQNGKVRESLGKYPLPPQIFNDDDFCGDYEDFDMANEVDELEKFLHIETISKDIESDSKATNHESVDLQLIADILENPPFQDEGLKNIPGELSGFKRLSVNSTYNPYEYHTFKIKYNNVNGLQEQIIETNKLAGENEQNEEVTKSEVNGDFEGVHPVNFSSENITENVDISAEEVLAPEKEEASTLENKANDESNIKESEGNTEGNEKFEVEVEKEAGVKEEKEDFENEKEEKVENLSEEKSPPLEEKESNVGNEDKEGNESEEENEDESPQSEKSQEE